MAAYRWFRASRVNFVPFEERGGRLVKVPTDDAKVWIEAVRRMTCSPKTPSILS